MRKASHRILTVLVYVWSDRGDEVLLFRETLQRLLDNGFAGAGDAEHETESSLLTMDLERVVNLLLLGQ
jgi:hypothetical protein